MELKSFIKDGVKYYQLFAPCPTCVELGHYVTPKSGFAKSVEAICMWGIMLICIALNVRMILKWSLLILSVHVVDKMD